MVNSGEANDGDGNAYELQRNENIKKNREIMQSLNLVSLKAAIGSEANTSCRGKKKAKTIPSILAASERPILRSTTREEIAHHEDACREDVEFQDKERSYDQGGKMHKRKRFNVVESSDPYAQEVQVEQQDHDDPDMLGEDNSVSRRAETLLPDVWNLAPGKRIVVQCNSLGQPIGREGGILGQFLGTVARNGAYCPIGKTDWRLVKQKGGDQTILQLVQTKFLYPRLCEKWILKIIGRDWKQYKATLKKSLFNAKKKRLVLYRRCPKDVQEDEWVAIVNHWKSKEGKRQNDPEKKPQHRVQVYVATHKDNSNHGQEHVAKLKNLVNDQPQLAENDGRVAWEGDALHQVLGDEKPGQVHGMGLLPVPKQAYDHMPRRLKNTEVITSDGSSVDLETHLMQEFNKLQEHLKEQKICMEQQDIRIEQQEKHIKKQDMLIEELQNKDACYGNVIPTQANVQTNYCDDFRANETHSKRKRVECDVQDLNVLLTEGQDTLVCNKKLKMMEDTLRKRHEQEKETNPSAMKVGTTVLLMTTRYPNKATVAYATFLSSSPDDEVGGIKLGNQYWKVRVNHPIAEREILVRPLQNGKTIGEVKGKTIAWPSICIEKING